MRSRTPWAVLGALELGFVATYAGLPVWLFTAWGGAFSLWLVAYGVGWAKRRPKTVAEGES